MPNTGTPERPAAAAALSADQAREEEAYTLGVQAWLWGYPLPFYAAMNAESLKIGAAGLNSFTKYPRLKTAKDRFVVTPNNVTIDAYAMFDVTREPAVIHVPALSAPRWYIVQVGDQFDQVIANVGGIKGPMPGAYAITGPDFRGDVPGEMTKIRSSTKMGVVAVRIFAAGEADVAAAAEAQKGFHLMPLSAYLREGPTHEPVKGSLPECPAEAPKELEAFERLGHAMQLYLPVSADNDDRFVAALRQIGLSVAAGFAWRTLDKATKRGLARARPVAEQIVDRKWESLGETTNGWRYNLAGGRSNHDLALRAALAKYMVGGQLAEQVLYPNCRVDAESKALDGTSNYVLRFEAGKLPPVAIFWNMAMYAEDMLFVENDFGRYSIGSTTDGLKPDTDGSLTILIQNARPDDTANWLPAPKGSFNMTMRFYGPATSVLDGSYRLPGVTRTQRKTAGSLVRKLSPLGKIPPEGRLSPVSPQRDVSSGRIQRGRAIPAISDLHEQALFTHAGQVTARDADVRSGHDRLLSFSTLATSQHSSTIKAIDNRS